MFLDVTSRRNPRLLDAARLLHQTGQILPDTYVLDLDTIEHNVKILADSAKTAEIELFYMTKQFGRNPLVSKKIHEAGIEKAVVVDYKEALVLMEEGLPLGNVGHLVQIPQGILKKILTYGTEYVTVFSIEKLKKINSVAKDLGIIQKILVKIIDSDDEVYEGQFGGFKLSEIKRLSDEVKQMANIQISGITSFPCFLFDGKSDLKLTHNVETVAKAKQMFLENGIQIEALNIPSATCSKTIPIIKSIGGTQGEPGHALTGTTPLHSKIDLPELPAMVYVSEISHNLAGKSYFYGGGYYRRGHLESALIFEENEFVKDRVLPFGAESIDYYLSTEVEHAVGSTVLAAFRTQIFVTRSDVAVVSGIQKGQPKLEGIYNSLGDLVKR